MVDMTMLAWWAAISGATLLEWLIAAFGPRLHYVGRLVVAVLGPAAVVGVMVFAHYLERRPPSTEPGSDGLFVISSVGAGAFASVLALPIWFVAEEKLGWRAV